MKWYFISEEELNEVRNGNADALKKACRTLEPAFDEAYKKYRFLDKEIFLQIERDIVKRIAASYGEYTRKIHMIVSDIVLYTNKYLLAHLADDNYKLMNDYLAFCGKNKLAEGTLFLKKIGYAEDIDTTLAIFDACPLFITDLTSLFAGASECSEAWINRVSTNDVMKHFIRMYMLRKDIAAEELDEDDEDFSEELPTSEISALSQYLNDIGTLNKKNLTAQEERELAKAASEGDMEARNQLVETNLKYVVKTAKKFFGRVNPTFYADLVQCGNVGLMKAAEKYDYQEGFRFKTYATWWIIQVIQRYLSSQSRSIRVPQYIHERIVATKKVITTFETDNGRKPTEEEIANILGVKVEHITDIIPYFYDTASLNSPAGEDEEAELMDFVSDHQKSVEERGMQSTFHEEILNLIEQAHLKQIEKEILFYRNGFYDGRVYTLDEVGKKYHFTRERARQLEGRALNKLRCVKNIDSFADVYLDYPEEAKKFRAEQVSDHSKVIWNENSQKNKKGREEVEMEKRHQKEIRNLFTFFHVADDERWKIRKIVEAFPESDQELFYIKYGTDLVGTEKLKLAPGQRNRFYGVLFPKVQKYYELLKDYNEEEFTSKLKELVANDIKIYKPDFVSLLVYFKNHFTYEELALAIDELSDNDKRIIQKRFGPKLDGEGGEKLERRENLTYNANVIPKLKNKLKLLYPERAMYVTSVSKKGTPSSANEQVEVKERNEEEIMKVNETSETTKENEKIVSQVIVNEVVAPEATEKEMILPEPEKEKNLERNVETVAAASIIDAKPTESIKEDTLENLVTPPVVSDNPVEQTNNNQGQQTLSAADFKDIKKIFNSPEFVEFTKTGFPIEQVVVASLFHGFLGRSFTIGEIAAFLKIDQSVVKEMIADSVEMYREMLNRKIDNYILELKK